MQPRSLAVPLGAWLVATALVSIVGIELLLRPARPLGSLYEVARMSAYLTAGVSITATFAAAVAFAMMCWATLRYLESPTTFDQVAAALLPSFWILFAHAILGLALFLMLPIPAPVLSAGPDAYLSAVFGAGPAMWVETTRQVALLLAVLSAAYMVRRKTGCGWVDVIVAVAVPVSAIVAISAWLNLLTARLLV